MEQPDRDLMRTARLAAIPNWQECVFEVTDKRGGLVLSLPFSGVELGSK